MKIALAQTTSAIGDLKANIANHLAFAEKASDLGANMVVFPELSLSGYEPDIVEQVALSPDAPELLPFHKLSQAKKITICVGVPIRTRQGITISMLIFEPDDGQKRYDKCYLHEDEEPHFVPGPNYEGTIANNPDLAIAICYEISIDAHAQRAADCGACFYIASVAKTPEGVAKATKRLQHIAKTYQMQVLMVNCIGTCEGREAGGGSLIIGKEGNVTSQLASTEPGLLLYDTQSQLCTSCLV